MENFEYYLEKEEVRKTFPNKERAKSVIKDSEQRISDADNIDIGRFSKIVFENYYDALRGFCDAILLNDGYKTYSHEAPIAYLLKKGFDISIVRILDNFRKKRHGSKYYGEPISLDEAKDIKGFYLKIKDKIYSLIGEI